MNAERLFVQMLLTIGILTTCSPADPPPLSRPDLVLVVIDTLRADRLSAYGYERPTSPGLETLAEEGVLFEDVTAQSTWTLPSMASMLSGRHVFVNAKHMPPSIPTLAERLKQTGYETVAFLGNPALSTPASGYQRGFDDVLDRDTTGKGNWDASDLGRAVENWLEEHPPGDAPRFYYLHFMDPHWPYDPQGETSLPGTARVRDDVLAAWVKRAKTDTPIREAFDRDRRSILESLDAYDHEILNVDQEIAHLLDALTREGKERLVIVASDHGEGLWDHEHHANRIEKLHTPETRTLSNVFFRDHSYHMFQELLFTPLIVQGPGFAGGQRIKRPVENVDIAPTLLRAAGISDDESLDGQPLQDVVAGTAPDKPYVFSHSKEATIVRRTSDNWKLISPTPTGDAYGMPWMMFQLSTDPHERQNLAPLSSDRQTKSPHLAEFRSLIGVRERAAKDFDLYLEGNAELSNDEQLQTLRELGYVGSAFDNSDAESGDQRKRPGSDGDR
jgi:arylsulfatase A-like enzyme